MSRCQKDVVRDIGDERLARAGELGHPEIDDALRRAFLRIPCPAGGGCRRRRHRVVDGDSSSAERVHPAISPGRSGARSFSIELPSGFPRGSSVATSHPSTFFAIDEFTETNGATWVIRARIRLRVTALGRRPGCKQSLPVVSGGFDDCLRFDALACGRPKRVGPGSPSPSTTSSRVRSSNSRSTTCARWATRP